MPDNDGFNSLLRQLVNQLPEAAFAVNQIQVVIAWNQRMESLTQTKADDIIGKPVAEIAAAIYGNGIPALVSLLDSKDASSFSWLILNESPQGIQGCFYAPALGKGKGAMVQVNARYISDGNQQIFGAVEVVQELSLMFGIEEEQEITRQWQAALDQLTTLDKKLNRGYEELNYKDKSIRESERRFRMVLENIPMVAMLLDPSGKIVFANDYSLKLFEYMAAEIIGKEFIEVLVPLAFRAEVANWIQLALVKQAPRRGIITLQGKDGKERRLSWISSLLYTPDDAVEGIIVLSEDVTEREETARALKDSEAILRQITDNMTDMISRLDRKGLVIYASPSHQTALGYRMEDLNRLRIVDLVHPDDYQTCINTLRMALQQGQTSRSQQRTRHASGNYIWTETVVNPVYENGRLNGVILSSRDITDRKKLEDNLRYLSVHDPLTGIYNRTYFETEMERLNSGRYDPVGIVVCDLDGLKLVNDTLGHEAGDRLLIATAEVLRRCFRKSDVISRVGGDEFAILLPSSYRDQLEMLVNRIYEGVGYYNVDNPDLPLSLSVGIAVKSSDTLSMREIYKEADNEMYRVKLGRSQSARSAVVQTLTKAMEARDYKTEGHAERLQDLVARMGKRLGVSDSTITTLRLFAQFHDIGKVGVPDRILFKPSLLNEEEYAEMKRHCEIGHRIALASQELTSLADLILKHHEWWNGKGYPIGLRGQDIPLECRILALADAYDAMTSNRPYRSGMKPREALREIEDHAGTQFDPVLADIFIEMLWEESMTREDYIN